MKKLRQFWRYRITQLIGGALLVGVVLPFIAGLVLKAFGFLHGTSLHSWLLDVGHHIPPLGAAGGTGAGAGAGSGGPGDPPQKPNPCDSERNAVDQAQQQIDSDQFKVDSLQMLFDQATGDLAQKLFDTYWTGRTAQNEWYQTPSLDNAMGALETGLQDIIGDPAGMPPPSLFPPASEWLDKMSNFFTDYDVTGAVAAAHLGLMNSADPGVDPSGMGTIPFATQEFIASLTMLEVASNMTFEYQRQLDNAKDQLKNDQQQLKDAQQALADCEASNSGGDPAAGDA